ncbi:protein of unknown function [Methanoculleus bourgensis]|uniref:Uncharacterized protein n=1 Tax=Methanoculleus bourgensis TaxID=83986 RepID=A0A0X3BN82_9EURY|nr:protein of unknown function [Methanoculleus bourgensis]
MSQSSVPPRCAERSRHLVDTYWSLLDALQCETEQYIAEYGGKPCRFGEGADWQDDLNPVTHYALHPYPL